MPVRWPFADDIIDLSGVRRSRISPDDAKRQTATAKTILENLSARPGVLLADEVGMGKTYVAMAVISSVIIATRREHCPVVVMVPPGLRQKWQRDWELFKSHCIRNHALDSVRDEYVHTPTEFFKLLDNPPKIRPQLVFITTGCFSRGLYDPWVKLAMIRLARRSTKLTDTHKRRLYRWAADLVRQFSNHRLTEDIIKELMHKNVCDWKRILVAHGILAEDDDDPVPEQLPREANRIDWTPLCESLRNLPGWRPECVPRPTRNSVRQKFNDAFRHVYQQWLNLAHWRSPLLVLDEAHHAKNDSTRLARLFRQESENDVALLSGKFDRMLFLTATPFQLGHQELTRILKSFAAVRWSSKYAPNGTRDDFEETMSELEMALDLNLLAARRFDRLWGKLGPESVAADVRGDLEESQHILEWWKRITALPGDEREKQLVQACQDCVKTRKRAERLLRPWLIRHNRLPYFPGWPDIPRRNVLPGRAILDNNNCAFYTTEGLPIDGHALLPFLIMARAQGQLAKLNGNRAFFAEGLASSYEAFHHTRDHRIKAKDFDDGLAAKGDSPSWQVPTTWYEKQIARLIPSREDSRTNRMAHPKVSATVKRTVDLWLAGEKVLVFCFYIQTARALYEHLRDEINQTIIKFTANKLGLDPQLTPDIEAQLSRIVRRLADSESPFHRELRSLIASEIDEQVAKQQYAVLGCYREKILGVLMAYFRSPSFVARYLPLDEPLVREALAKGETRRNVIARGIDALQRAILERKDASNQTYRERIIQFLDFATELAERAQRRLHLKKDESTEDTDNPLLEYLDAVSIYSKPRRPECVDEDYVANEKGEKDDGSYRVMPLVRIVYGATKTDVRDRLMLAFNSPLFPEILVSSSVMAEGVDLHRFCRHVIHHDLCWNPSNLEQRTGRLDRVRCKAEVCRCPILVYEPFIAGGADEKMFRVLRDRERWFQIVMGQKFEFDEKTSESMARRIPLPMELADSLTFDLACWRDDRFGKYDMGSNKNGK